MKAIWTTLAFVPLLLLTGSLFALADAPEKCGMPDPALSEPYYLDKMLELSFDDARAKVADALKTEGFAILTEIDLQAKLKEKLDKDIPRYVILGACSADFAAKAYDIDDRIGVLLPCNVVLHELEDGSVELLIRNPHGLALADRDWQPVADEVYAKMQAVLAAL